MRNTGVTRWRASSLKEGAEKLQGSIIKGEMRSKKPPTCPRRGTLLPSGDFVCSVLFRSRTPKRLSKPILGSLFEDLLRPRICVGKLDDERFQLSARVVVKAPSKISLPEDPSHTPSDKPTCVRKCTKLVSQAEDLALQGPCGPLRGYWEASPRLPTRPRGRTGGYWGSRPLSASHSALH